MNLFSCVAFGLSLKLPSETILLNSSAHEFLGAGSSLSTTGSKIESKLKLGCSISCEKLFWVRKSSSSLSVMSIMTKHNKWMSCLKAVRSALVYRKKLVNKIKRKTNNRTHQPRNKENTMHGPLWSRRNIKVQRSLSLSADKFSRELLTVLWKIPH